MDYFSSTCLVYDDDSKDIVEEIKSNKYGTIITAVHVDEFISNSSSFVDNIEHLVVSISKYKISYFLEIAHRYNISIGIIPLATQNEQIKSLLLSSDLNENLEIALRKDFKTIDLIEINGELIYSQGVIGTVPLVGENLTKIRSSFYKTFIYSLKKFFSIRLEKFEITTENGQKIITSGSGIVILNHSKGGLISKIFKLNHSMRDGKITAIIISPYSIIEYIRLISSIFIISKEKKKMPASIGYIQSKSLTIKASSSKKINLSGSQSITLPISCRVVPDAIKLNASDEFWLQNEQINTTKETIKILNLPDISESDKYTSEHIPFVKSASEERFKELFQILRVDSKINFTYIVLMLLSTLLASFGLFANSAAVIIGAMLLAPLMTPIVSISMGLLRADAQIIKDSFLKIVLGIFVALGASAFLSFFLEGFELTSEMISRINPTLLDLGVAILSGVAAAYSKSFKEITQNLAGVAIAVALVPPLSVAGIGLGYGDINTFLGAFLLFFTNLVGIILAAVITFELLGFSSTLKSKKSVTFVFVLVLAVIYPLYLSYDNMVKKYEISQIIKEHRFLVNGKYIIVDKADVVFLGNMKVINLSLVVRESLNRSDLKELKQDIERLFNQKLFIKSEVKYIL